MGWWRANQKTGGIRQMDEILGVPLDEKEDEEVLNGDDPADFLGEALTWLDAIWMAEWGRLPSDQEVESALRFAITPAAREESDNPGRRERNAREIVRRYAQLWPLQNGKTSNFLYPRIIGDPDAWKPIPAKRRTPRRKDSTSKRKETS